MLTSGRCSCPHRRGSTYHVNQLARRERVCPAHAGVYRIPHRCALNLSGQLDYLHKLTSQLHWQGNPGDRGIRVLYNQSGTPTAALLESDAVLVDYTLYWIACKDINEANYLMAIINSNALYEMVRSLMPKGQYGARHLQKHLWKLPISEFDPRNELHAAISEAGGKAATGASAKLDELRDKRREKLTWRITRRELRGWLRTSDEGQAVETAVGRLLAGE